MSTSASPDPARLRLAQYMDDRRADLRLTWAEVARAAGINRETLRQIRSGTSDIRALTQRAVEDALRWKSGSIRTILSGGDPTPLKTAESERPPGDEIGELLADIKRLALRAQRLEAERRETDSSHRDEDTA